MALLSLGSVATADDNPSKRECVGANERAQSLRIQGGLVAARSELALCVSSSCPGPVREDCADRIAEIDRAMPTLLFDVSGPAGEPRRHVALYIDGESIARDVDDGAVSVDPGVHTFRLLPREGGQTSLTLAVVERQKERHVVVVVSSNESHKQRTAGQALVGVGLAGLVAGGVIGLVAKSTYDSAISGQCHGNASECSPGGVDGVHSANTQAAASTATFVVGAALLAGGVTLWATAPARLSVAPTTGGASMALAGRF